MPSLQPSVVRWSLGFVVVASACASAWDHPARLASGDGEALFARQCGGALFALPPTRLSPRG